jgi:hypothetical protein
MPDFAGIHPVTQLAMDNQPDKKPSSTALNREEID